MFSPSINGLPKAEEKGPLVSSTSVVALRCDAGESKMTLVPSDESKEMDIEEIIFPDIRDNLLNKIVSLVIRMVSSQAGCVPKRRYVGKKPVSEVIKDYFKKIAEAYPIINDFTFLSMLLIIEKPEVTKKIQRAKSGEQKDVEEAEVNFRPLLLASLMLALKLTSDVEINIKFAAEFGSITSQVLKNKERELLKLFKHDLNFSINLQNLFNLATELKLNEDFLAKLKSILIQPQESFTEFNPKKVSKEKKSIIIENARMRLAEYNKDEPVEEDPEIQLNKSQRIYSCQTNFWDLGFQHKIFSPPSSGSSGSLGSLTPSPELVSSDLSDCTP